MNLLLTWLHFLQGCRHLSNAQGKLFWSVSWWPPPPPHALHGTPPRSGLPAPSSVLGKGNNPPASGQENGGGGGAAAWPFDQGLQYFLSSVDLVPLEHPLPRHHIFRQRLLGTSSEHRQCIGVHSGALGKVLGVWTSIYHLLVIKNHGPSAVCCWQQLWH